MRITAYEYITIFIDMRLRYLYLDVIFLSMYQMCPAGLLDVFYSAVADDQYKSPYWVEKDGVKILKYSWMDGVTYIYSVKKVDFKKEVKLTIMSRTVTFNFDVLSVEKMMDKNNDHIEMLTFRFNDAEKGEVEKIFIAAYELEEKIYLMNHLPRSEIFDEN